MPLSLSLSPPSEATIVGAAQQIRERRLTCLDLLDQCLARIDEHDPELRAWVLVDRDGARAQARSLDRELDGGGNRGPLHGIPLGIKDIIDVAGLPTAAGSTRLAQSVARRDATVVARLRQAGAVILGKTVTTQFASFDPPVTRNPWHLERTPGGSSSGSAAALAAGMCLGALGSQTGGSITRPASFCGVAGCKPTYGLVAQDGVLPLAPALDHVGPMARTVDDLRLLLDVLEERAPFRQENHAARPGAPPALGRVRGLFDERADPASLFLLEAALETLSVAGASVVDAPLPAAFDDVLRAHRVIMAAEAAAGHEQRMAAHPDDYLPFVRGLIEEGLSIPAAEYVRCRQHQERLRAAIFASFAPVSTPGAQAGSRPIDALVCLAATGPAPDTSTTGDPAFNSPWSYTGLPTVSFPIGLSPDGLPLSLQLVGRLFGEKGLFETAAWCEQRLQEKVRR